MANMLRNATQAGRRTTHTGVEATAAGTVRGDAAAGRRRRTADDQRAAATRPAGQHAGAARNAMCHVRNLAQRGTKLLQNVSIKSKLIGCNWILVVLSSIFIALVIYIIGFGIDYSTDFTSRGDKLRNVSLEEVMQFISVGINATLSAYRKTDYIAHTGWLVEIRYYSQDESYTYQNNAIFTCDFGKPQMYGSNSTDGNTTHLYLIQPQQLSNLIRTAPIDFYLDEDKHIRSFKEVVTEICTFSGDYNLAVLNCRDHVSKTAYRLKVMRLLTVVEYTDIFDFIQSTRRTEDTEKYFIGVNFFYGICVSCFLASVAIYYKLHPRRSLVNSTVQTIASRVKWSEPRRDGNLKILRLKLLTLHRQQQRREIIEKALIKKTEIVHELLHESLNTLCTTDVIRIRSYSEPSVN